MAESSLQVDQVSHNCMYGKKSTFCKKGDAHKAWSSDCGLAQINTKGSICPKELLEPEHNLAMAKKIKDTQGLKAWVAYSSKAYLKYM